MLNEGLYGSVARLDGVVIAIAVVAELSAPPPAAAVVVVVVVKNGNVVGDGYGAVVGLDGGIAVVERGARRLSDLRRRRG